MLLLHLCLVLCGCCILRSSVSSAPAPFVSAPLFSACCGSSCSFSLPPHFSACCGYGFSFPSSSLFFPRAAASTAPSSLPPRFPLAATPAASCAFGETPVNLLVEGSPDAVPRGPVLRFPAFMLFPIVRTFIGFFRFSSVCFLGRRALPLCLLLLVLCLRFSSLQLWFILSRYTLLSFECCYYFLWCFCLVQISSSLRDVVSLWGRSGFAAASVSLSSQGCFVWWYPFLFGSPFCSSDSFTSKVPLATWLPFGMSLAYFGALSSSGFWFFPDAVPFPTRSSSIRPSSVSSLVSFRGCRLRSLRCLSIYGCFVSALRLLYSVRGSLFLSWPFFVCATPSSVSGA